MKKIVLLIFISLFFTSCLPDAETFELDTISPYVESITWNLNNDFDLSRDGNQSFDKVLNNGFNMNVAVNSKINIQFSEEMYPESLAEYGVSESIVIIEGEPSKTLLSDLKSPPLTDTNAAKILNVKVKVADDNKSITLDFSSAEDCFTEDDYKTKFCKLKIDTSYSLIIGQSVMDINGRTLSVNYGKDSNDNNIQKEDNFVLLFRTIGFAPTILSSSPSHGDIDVCPNLKAAIINFSTDILQDTITDNSFYITDGTKFTNVTLTKTDKSATLTLNENLKTDTAYAIVVTTDITSKSRVKLDKKYEISFMTASTISTDGPVFVSGPTGTLDGGEIKVDWTTDVDSKATVKYSKEGQGENSLEVTTFSKVHSVNIPIPGPGLYHVTIDAEDKCGNSSSKSESMTVENHPMITEVSPNSNNYVDYIELYNPGQDSINLENYNIVVGSDAAVTLPTFELKSKEYVVIATDTSSLSATNKLDAAIEDDYTKSEDITLNLGATLIDAYRYDFKAGGADNKSAQKRELTATSTYCEATPTPGTPNVCQ